MNGQTGGSDSGPGIFQVGTSKLNIVKLAEACFMHFSKIESWRARYTFECDANAAQEPQVNTLASNGRRIVGIRRGIVSAWEAKKHVTWHVVCVQGFKMLSALKSNSSMGRAMPELVERSAMGVATVGQAGLARGLKMESFSSEKLPRACVRKSLACKSRGMALVICLMTHGSNLRTSAMSVRVLAQS